MNLQRLLLVASSSLACAASTFTITPGTTQASTSSVDNVKFVKQWTLTAASTADAIHSIDLDLVGRVFVRHVSGLPTGVLGYVNVSGDSRAVVDAVAVAHDDANDVTDNDNENDNDNDNDNDTMDPDGDLHVHLSSNASTSLSGFLLTEVLLAATGVVTDLQSKRSAVVVVENGVLLTSSTTGELQVEASGSSAIFVSAANSSVSTRQLQLDAKGSASLQFDVKSISVSNEAQVDAQGSGQVVILASTVEAATLELDAENTGAICFSGQQVTAKTYRSDEDSRISMPNAADKHGATGSASCARATAPSREPACAGSGCTGGSSATPGGAAGPAAATTPGATGGNTAGISASDGTSASSTAQLAVLVAAAAVGVAMATLL